MMVDKGDVAVAFCKDSKEMLTFMTEKEIPNEKV